MLQMLEITTTEICNLAETPKGLKKIYCENPVFY